MPCRVQGLEGIKMVMVACGDAFTVAIGAGESEQDESGRGKHVVGDGRTSP